MKNKFIKFNIIYLLLLIFTNLSIAQNSMPNQSYINKGKELNKTSLSKSSLVTNTDLVINIISSLFELEYNFKYYRELKSGNYKVEYSDNSINIKFLNKYNKYDIINFNIVNDSMNLDVVCTSYLKDYLNTDFNTPHVNINESSSLLNINNWFFNNKIIIDKNLLNNYGNIFNRNYCHLNLRDADNNPAHIFSHISDGIIIPFFTGTWEPLTIAVDQSWSRFIDFTNIGSSRPFNGYGSLSTDVWGFSKPTGIAYITPTISNSGSCIFSTYPIYIVDKNFGRISRFNYTIENCAPIFGVHNPEQWSIFIKNLNSPFDIESHKGIDQNNPNDDILWVSESPGLNRIGGSLVCINSASGEIFGRINKLNFGSGNENIYPTRLSVYRSPNGSKNVLSFIDENKNALVFCRLNPNGKPFSSGNPIFAIIGFGYQKLNSVMLNSLNNGLGETMVWTVTDGGAGSCEGGQNCGYLSSLKINYVLDQPVSVDYLSSSWIGNGSDKSFVNLENLYANNGFNEIFTIEKWSENYGIRRYRNGVDIIAEDFTNSSKKYCMETGYSFNLKLTNPSRVYFQCWYNCGAGSCTWVPTSINYINGVYTNSDSYFLNAGNSNINMKLDKPNPESMSGNEKFRIKMTVVPIDEDNINSSYGISRQIDRNIQTCNVSGGCPFVYVYDGIDFIQDNNILHRSEFENNIGIDIEDKYILNVNPYIDKDSIISLKTIELNQDQSYIDNFKLIVVDHPIGTKLGITEFGQYVLYLPSFVASPYLAFFNGLDITEILQFDTTNSEVSGEAGGTISSDFPNEEGNDLNIKKLNKFIYRNQINYYKEKFNIREQITDSIAIIMDPNQSDAVSYPTTKSDAGTIIAFNENENFESAQIPFARRQNNSNVIIPLSDEIYIDSVYITWNNDFAISYLATTIIYYGGYIMKELELIQAENTNFGSVLDDVSNIDERYAELFPAEEIRLKFKVDTLEPSYGFQRSYVFVTKGRYQLLDGIGRNTNIFDNSQNIPQEFNLNQNYPNPFNPVTTIKYDIPEDGNLTLSIHDITGREIFLAKEYKKAGSYSIVFNGSNYASGVYFYRLTFNGKKQFSKTLKMLLVK
ncbi:MAG TPA: T9SS type A sorting domain-containing protein [Ignavibacteria bacterium]|nr:T9SS type A sorting domain-containing protein [Ignavibacteria bacterium]